MVRVKNQILTEILRDRFEQADCQQFSVSVSSLRRFRLAARSAAAAESGGSRYGNERISGAFGGRFDKVC